MKAHVIILGSLLIPVAAFAQDAPNVQTFKLSPGDLQCVYDLSKQASSGNPTVDCGPGWSGFIRLDTPVKSITVTIAGKPYVFNSPPGDFGSFSSPGENKWVREQLTVLGVSNSQLDQPNQIRLTSFVTTATDLKIYPNTAAAEAQKNALERLYCGSATNQHPNPRAGTANAAFTELIGKSMKPSVKAKFLKLGGVDCKFASLDAQNLNVQLSKLQPTTGRGCGSMTVCYSEVVCIGQMPDKKGKWDSYAVPTRAACADCSMTLDQCVADDRVDFEDPLAKPLKGVAVSDGQTTAPSSDDTNVKPGL